MLYTASLTTVHNNKQKPVTISYEVSMWNADGQDRMNDTEKEISSGEKFDGSKWWYKFTKLTIRSLLVTIGQEIF